MPGSIRRRGQGSYEIRWELSPDPRTGLRRQRSLTVYGTKRQAEDRLADEVRRVRTGIDIEPSRLTVGDYLDRWLADYAAHNVSPSTYARYRSIVTVHLKPVLGEVLLQRLRPAQIQSAYTSWLERKPRPLSPATVIKHHRLLHEALSHAVGWQLLATNPAEAVRAPSVPALQPRALDAEEAARLLEAAQDGPYASLIEVALATGMRRGELVGLRWGDVDLERGQISVRRTANRGARGEGITTGEPKTARSRRTIPLSPATVAVLRAHHQKQVDATEPVTPAAPVWTRPGGRLLDPQRLGREVQALAAEAGLGHVRFHDLRHTAGSLLAASGVSARTIADLLGHASPAFTLAQYTETVGDAAERAVQALSDALAGGQR